MGGFVDARTHVIPPASLRTVPAKKKEKPTEVLIGQVLHCLSDSVYSSSFHLEPFIGLSPGSVCDSYPEDNEAHAQPQANELGTFQSVRPAECERC